MIDTSKASIETPQPAANWVAMTDAERLTNTNKSLEAASDALRGNISVTAAKQDGQILVHLRQQLPADKRGTQLLDLEAYLKSSLDPALVVWLEPLGDKNSLRNLRGIEVKS